MRVPEEDIELVIKLARAINEGKLLYLVDASVILKPARLEDRPSVIDLSIVVSRPPSSDAEWPISQLAYLFGLCSYTYSLVICTRVQLGSLSIKYSNLTCGMLSTLMVKYSDR